MTPDRQSLLQSIVESALRAAADPAVTAVLRSWDYYDPGETVQPLMPLLIVSVTNDRDIGIDLGLYTATVQVSLICDWAPSMRDMYDRVRSSVRSAVHALRGVSLAGLTVDSTREVSCTEPTLIDPDGDVVFGQTLTYTVWFEAPVTPDAVIDPDPYLIDHDAETGYTYLTTQAADPRRIERWSGSVFSYAYGAWADRASLHYSSPVPPPTTSVAPASP